MRHLLLPALLGAVLSYGFYLAVWWWLWKGVRRPITALDADASSFTVLSGVLQGSLLNTAEVVYPKLVLQHEALPLSAPTSQHQSRTKRRSSDLLPRADTQDLRASSPTLPNSTILHTATTAQASAQVEAAEDYFIYALPLFGEQLLLNVSRSRDYVAAPSFLVQHVETNYTWWERFPVSTGSTHRNATDACLFEGFVVGQPHSKAVLNLCYGLYGSVHTDNGTYFIEPLVTDSYARNRSSASRTKPERFPHLLYSYSQTFQRRALNEHGRNESKRHNDQTDGDVIRFAQDAARRQRRAASAPVGLWSNDHYVEVLIVADTKMSRYHGSHLEDYVLTLMSIVASIYRHPSIEASMHVVLVRLLIVEHENAGPQITDNAQETLKHFCRWQNALNDADDSSVNHHDVAIMLTRQDICRSPGKCDTLGLAELGTVCDGYRSCAIIEDNGLSAAFTIAHELGHLFNIPHDDEKKCAEWMTLEKENYHIMAPTLEYNTNPWSWSPCSAETLKLFLDERRNVFCLEDKPAQLLYFTQMDAFSAPGKHFDVDEQCQFVFGPSASVCPYMPSCKRLWCATVYGYQVGCRTQHMPWADGTSCGFNRWCHKGHCVGMSDEHLQAVAGGWGAWKTWSECSRPCGGGIKYAFRACDNPRPSNGGRYCTGMRVRYRPCNTKDCPADMPDFREHQCSKYDGKTFHIYGLPRDVRWVPKYTRISPNERCKLWCEVAGSPQFFYKLEEKVIDGTPCDRFSDDMCVHGQCVPAGCDHRPGGTLKRDQCGLCGGDGSTCRKVSGSVNDRQSYGYNVVLKIPTGASHLDIKQHGWNSRKEDDNYLALQNGRGEFILNGNFKINPSEQEIVVRGTILFYSGADHVVEYINSSRPTLEDLYLHVLSVGGLHAPDLAYDYVVSDEPGALLYSPQYYWKLADEWTQCSRMCQGEQTRVAVCMDGNTEERVDEELCRNVAKPPALAAACNTNCQLRWEAKALSECSVRCGAGVVNQEAVCMLETSNAEPRVVEIGNCPEALKPTDTAPCYRDCAGRQWIYSAWSECPVTCGGGQQHRDAACVDERKQRLEEHLCAELPKGEVTRVCNQLTCPHWDYGHWSECSHSCDGGLQIRSAVCQDVEGREVASQLCGDADKQYRRPCNTHACTHWKFGDWSQCSRSCGTGVVTREAWCLDSRSNQLDAQQCDQRTKITSKACNAADCPRWHLAEWSPCSHSCGDGWKSRAVTCRDGTNREVDPRYCKGGGAALTPNTHEPCNQGQCPVWVAKDWPPCSATCGMGTQDRAVTCVWQQRTVDDSYCRMEKPLVHRFCNMSECPEWEVGAWSECSVTCGEGVQTRRILCYQATGHIPADSTSCNQTSKPKDTRPCRLVHSCPTSSSTVASPTTTTNQLSTSTAATTTPYSRRTSPSPTARPRSRTLRPVDWAMGQWSECSTTCGYGTQQRYVACRDLYGRILPELYCLYSPKPAEKQNCSTSSLCGEWHTEAWQPCPATCGAQVKRWRLVTCVPANSNLLPPDACDPATRPPNEETCELPECDDISNKVEKDMHSFNVQTRWRVGAWSECSVSCGDGWQQRVVICLSADMLDYRPPLHCAPGERPPAVQQCSLVACPTWKVGPWSECSQSCGGGLQSREVQCRGDSAGELLPEQSCAGWVKPDVRQACNTQKCRRFHWKTYSWSSCSVTCGRGLKTRSAVCVSEEDGQQVDANQCATSERPALELGCSTGKCPRWKHTRWSECSTTCNAGVRTRLVYCGRGRRFPKTPSAQCAHLPRPSDRTECSVQSCPTYSWQSHRWSQCSEQCGNGSQVRQVVCVNAAGQQAPARQCVAAAKPVAIRPCVRKDCDVEWSASTWSQCSKTCDQGIQVRSVTCRITTANRTVLLGSEVPAERCAVLDRPITQRNCSSGTCTSRFFWQMGLWTPCTATCGQGVQRRTVRCINQDGRKASKQNCVQKMRPPSRQICFIRNCLATDCREAKSVYGASENKDYELLVGGQAVQVYCHGMNDSHPVEYLTLPAGMANNYAEVYGKRLLYPFTCPHGGSRSANCSCTDSGSPKVGLTRFSKVRIDLYSMKIHLHDYRFATTVHGKPVPFASAGDCYSAVDCPQGAFRIDLSGTAFRISPRTTWDKRGHRASARIDVFEDGRSIHGVCGGYCGHCEPSRESGLLVELRGINVRDFQSDESTADSE